MYDKIGFIGTGNMGGALAAAAANSGLCRRLYLANRTRSKAEALASSLGGAIVSDNLTIAKECELIFLCVKPQQMPGVLNEVKAALKSREDRFIIVSVATGLTVSTLYEMLGKEYPLIRIMPNTPIKTGEGILLYCSSGCRDEEISAFVSLMNGTGLVDKTDESLMDAASAVAGCGPAFAYIFIEALADGAVACGLPHAKALAYAAKMLEGSAKLALESGKHPGELKDEVCSPAGSTIQGVKALEEHSFRAAAADAVIAAYKRTVEIKRGE